MTNKQPRPIVLAVLLGAGMAAIPGLAAAQDSAKLSEIERKIDILTGEIERLKLGEASGEGDLKSTFGLGPAASKIYKKGVKKVSVGGYGEMIYENFRARKEDGAASGKSDQLDFLRGVLYLGYKFNDWITFNSEIEFEHATEGGRGEISLEMAALDFAPCKHLGLRAGLLLLPVGLVNEVHEPVTFHGVKRPSVETNLYPTTWRENGVGLFGEYGPLSYRSYLVAGLQAASDGTVTGFNASSGIRSGRSEGSKSKAQDFAWVSRLDVTPFDNVVVGASLYTGEADHNMTAKIPVTFWDLHAKGTWRGFDARALLVDGKIGNVDELNVSQGNAAGGTSSVGSRLFGGYVEAAFDVLSLAPQTSHYLAPFFRYERYDTQKEVPVGWVKNPANSRVEYTMGLTYKPIPEVVVKFDHQIMRNQASTGVGQTNLGIGYIF